jgi:hypothetical protein
MTPALRKSVNAASSASHFDTEQKLLKLVKDLSHNSEVYSTSYNTAE